MNEFLLGVLPELIATLIGIFIGSYAAIRIDRRTEHRHKLKRKNITLKNIQQELNQNYHTIKAVLDAYKNTPYGKGIYVSTIAWETSVAHGDLQDVIGSELSDVIENQYSRLLNLRYYVDLLTTLWFSPKQIDGYEIIRSEFRSKIIDIIEDILAAQAEIVEAIDNNLK
jgi:hypothetical protein